MDKENKSNILKNLALVSQIGISMVVPIIGGIALGNLLDKWLGTGVVFLVILSIVGIMSSFITLFKITNKDHKRK